MRHRTLLRFFHRLTGISLVALACSGLTGSKAPTLLEKIRSDGRLYVLTRSGPTTYYHGPSGYTGFEYNLAKAFADELGVELVIQEETNLAIQLASLGGPKAHIAASGLTITDDRKAKVRFGTPYFEVSQQVIYHRRNQRPASVADLLGRDLLIVANSSHSERLRQLRKEYPALRWRERNDLEMLDLMEMVHTGELDYAVVDSNSFAINRNLYPNVQAAFDLSEPQQLAWAFPKLADSSLYDAAEAFFSRIKEDGSLAALTERYFKPNEIFNDGGAELFAERIEKRLPQWEDYLRTAGAEYGIDWRLLAAISYQESHWNPRARSHTGVRGLMMLTLVTARELGIANRVDPEQSITGGARYFRQIYDRLPAGIQGADRLYMALAAYNVGSGHLEDARQLTEAHGDNPNRWDDVKRYLPLLAKPNFYKQTQYGYARGWEPVIYVERINEFYNILRWHDERRQQRQRSLVQHAVLDNFDDASGAERQSASL